MIECIKKMAKRPEFGKWIPASERLPEEYDSIFAKYKGTKKWVPGMFKKTSDEVIVTVINSKGKTATTHAHTNDGAWKSDLIKLDGCRIIAWMPLPEPYKEREDKDAEVQELQ